MTAIEIVNKASAFATGFIDGIQNEDSTQQAKQLYFMDNQDELRKYMSALQKTIEALKQEQANDSDEEKENQELLAMAEGIVANLKQAISKFQAELTIDANVAEEDVTPALTEEAIGDAMKNNKTTQDIAADMETIAQQNAIPYNYMLVCDGDTIMIAAPDKQTLETNINKAVENGAYNSIRLYKLAYTPVPLKTKTILSV